MVVSRHVVQHQHTFQALARFGNYLPGLFGLRLAGHQGGADLQRPAMVLDDGHFDPSRTHLNGHFDGARKLMQVLPVQDRVERERNAQSPDPLGSLHLAFETAAIAANAIGHLRIGSLQRKLDMVQTSSIQILQTLLRQTDG